MVQRKLHNTIAEPNALVAHFCDGLGHGDGIAQMLGLEQNANGSDQAPKSFVLTGATNKPTTSSNRVGFEPVL